MTELTIDLDKYRSLMEQLKKNKENVPLELLTTKYRKSYEQLKEQLRIMTKEILQDVVLADLRIERAEAEEAYQKINSAIKESGVLDKVSHAVFHQQDVDQVLECAKQLRMIVHQVKL